MKKTLYRRRLPHIIPPNGTFFVTARLAGSLPKNIIEKLKKKRDEELEKIKTQWREGKIDSAKVALLKERTCKRHIGKLDASLHRQTNVCWLSIPAVAKLVTQAIHYRDDKVYHLMAFTIMPNHIHIVFTQIDTSLALYQIMGSLKKFTAREANKILGRKGSFWQDESFDHLVRNKHSLMRIIGYVLDNPISANLAERWQDWPYSYVKRDYRDYF